MKRALIAAAAIAAIAFPAARAADGAEGPGRAVDAAWDQGLGAGEGG